MKTHTHKRIQTLKNKKKKKIYEILRKCQHSNEKNLTIFIPFTNQIKKANKTKKS